MGEGRFNGRDGVLCGGDDNNSNTREFTPYEGINRPTRAQEISSMRKRIKHLEFALGEKNQKINRLLRERDEMEGLCPMGGKTVFERLSEFITGKMTL